MKGRIFTPEFKLSVVRAVLSGEKSVVQLCREHNLIDSCIHNWKKLYRLKGEAAFTAPTIARSGSVMLHRFRGVYKAEKKDCILITKGQIWAPNIHRNCIQLNLSGRPFDSWKQVARAALLLPRN